MLSSGVLTFTMVFAAVTPQLALSTMFGSSLEGPLAEVVVRNWGALIALIGGMLIYGAFRKEVRNFVLSVAAISKFIFIALVILNGFSTQLLAAITFDAILILVFLTHILTNWQANKAAR